MLPPFELSELFFLLNHPSSFDLLSTSSVGASVDGPAQLVGGFQLQLDGTKVVCDSLETSVATVVRLVVRLKVSGMSGTGSWKATLDIVTVATSKHRRGDCNGAECDPDDDTLEECDVDGRGLGSVGIGGDTLSSVRFRACFLFSRGEELERGRYESCSLQIVFWPV